MAFPNGFLWGGAVTAHQSEGAYYEGGKLCLIRHYTENTDRQTFLM